MGNQKCHCNGSSGTDCYYCQGTGIVTVPFHSGGAPPIIKSTLNKYQKVVSENRHKSLPDRIRFLEAEMKQTYKDSKIIKHLREYINATWKDLLLAKQPTTTSTKRQYQDYLNRVESIKTTFKNKFRHK